MKLTLILLLVASSQAAKVTSARSKDRTEEFEKEKRESNRDSGLEKRTPLLPSVSPSATPGVEYARTQEPHSDQSPSQQIYATPVPQLSKISDVLTQGGPYQAAIANQLYSPVSVYQSRFPTYEVSPPVPSQLAYAEHSIQPQNIQSIPKGNLAANYQPQIFQQYETSVPQQIPANYQQTTSAISNQPIDYQQPLVQYQQYSPEQLQPQAYRQEIPVTYQAEQLRTVQEPQNVQQVYTSQPSQGAISYASFAQNQREQFAQNQQQLQYQPQQLIKYQLQHQPIQYQVPQAQPQQYQAQQFETSQFQIQQPNQYQQSEPKVQYQPQLPPLQIQQYQPQYVKSKQSEKQLYFKQLQQPAVVQQIQPQQTKLAQQYTQAPAQSTGHAGQVALPTFPPVQYFGKFAHSIFGQQ